MHSAASEEPSDPLAALFRLLPYNPPKVPAKDLELLRAARFGEVEKARQLIQDGANVNTIGVSWEKHTPLMWACLYGHNSIAKMLLDHGARTDLREFDSHTALMFAAKRGRVEIVRLLLDSQCDINQKSYWGTTALMLAEEEGHNGIAKMIREAS